MQLYIALLALTAGVVTAQGPNYPPRNPFNPFRPRIPVNFPDTTCPDSHPNGYGPGIGPTDCGQLTRDCGYFGVGQTCTTDYSYIVGAVTSQLEMTV